MRNALSARTDTYDSVTLSVALLDFKVELKSFGNVAGV